MFFILFYFILFYFILFYFILFYFILFYFILFYFILFIYLLFFVSFCLLFCDSQIYPVGPPRVGIGHLEWTRRRFPLPHRYFITFPFLSFLFFPSFFLFFTFFYIFLHFFFSDTLPPFDITLDILVHQHGSILFFL